MKKLLVTALAGVALATAVNGQGTVNFKNYFTGTASDPIIFFSNGTTAAQGSQYVIALMGGPSAGSLSQVATIGFYPGAPGYFVGPSVAVPGVAGGTAGTFQIDVWDTTLNGTTTGATFAQAEAYAVSAGVANIWGSSAVFTTVTGNPSATPPGLPQNLTFSSFNLNPVPEPTALALLGLGSAGLMFFRRRK